MEKYEIGMSEPSDEEFAVYLKVKRYLQRDAVAAWMDCELDEFMGQEAYEKACADFEKLDRNDGEHEWELIWFAVNGF